MILVSARMGSGRCFLPLFAPNISAGFAVCSLANNLAEGRQVSVSRGRMNFNVSAFGPASPPPVPRGKLGARSRERIPRASSRPLHFARSGVGERGTVPVPNRALRSARPTAPSIANSGMGRSPARNRVAHHGRLSGHRLPTSPLGGAFVVTFRAPSCSSPTPAWDDILRHRAVSAERPPQGSGRCPQDHTAGPPFSERRAPPGGSNAGTVAPAPANQQRSTTSKPANSSRGRNHGD